jgi:hypothetical protein
LQRRDKGKVNKVHNKQLSCGQFYIYKGFGLDELVDCADEEWDASEDSQLMAEVFFFGQLANHPARTMDQAAASLFVVPVFPHLSFDVGFGQENGYQVRYTVQRNKAGELNEKLCEKKTHAQRMQAVELALQASEAFARHNGSDHIFISNAYNVKEILEAYNPRLRQLLAGTIHGWYEPADHLVPIVTTQVVSDCTIVVPFVESNFSVAELEKGHKRNITLLFRGAIKAMGNGSPRRHFPALAKGISGADIEDRSPRGKRVTGTEHKQSMADLMRRSKFCLVPSGDTPNTSRLFDALAAGCIPVIISQLVSLPFDDIIPWHLMAIVIPTPKYTADPVGTVRSLVTSLSAVEVARLQKGIAKHAGGVLWRHRAGTSRVAVNVLETACKILRRRSVCKRGLNEQGYYGEEQYVKRQQDATAEHDTTVAAIRSAIGGTDMVAPVAVAVPPVPSASAAATAAAAAATAGAIAAADTEALLRSSMQVMKAMSKTERHLFLGLEAEEQGKLLKMSDTQRSIMLVSVTPPPPPPPPPISTISSPSCTFIRLLARRHWWSKPSPPPLPLPLLRRPRRIWIRLPQKRGGCK